MNPIALVMGRMSSKRNGITRGSAAIDAKYRIVGVELTREEVAYLKSKGCKFQITFFNHRNIVLKVTL